ncbi:uracil-DNA glycosylase family protein [Paraburkholderia fungorum]|uniref:uracil-DNA glycosylase n=1 Tax=Paraburkholderia fungorum TaxID=134537 RepID=UPI0038B6F118
MALHESVLEEFGIAPLWVRRGMSAPSESAGQTALEPDAVAAAASVARPDDPRAAAREASPATLARDGGQLASAPVSASTSASANDTPPATGRVGEARQPMKPSPQPSRTPEPPAFDAPPDDDFAWFDDQPAHAPAETRRETPESSIQTLDWDGLSGQVAACERCRLCEKRTNTVFGIGDRNADWMLIGEAPGENEDRLGEPFVGPAGKLLDNMLRSLTLARDTNVYIANVIKCRPPGNRNPEPDEVARCEPYLQRQVALVKPKLIIALGRFAAQSLLRTEASISSLRGRVHEYEGVPVIVTYHPAYLLRSLPDKAKAWADLCLARDTWLAAGGVPSQSAR